MFKPALLALVSIVVPVSLGACSSETAESDAPEAFAGFVRGSDSFALELVPLAGDDSAETPTTWTVSDPAIADVIQSDGARRARVVAKGPGDAEVRSAAGGSIRIHFTEFSAAELEAGKARYETGRAAPAAKACKTCHADGALAEGAHDRWMNRRSDAEILDTAENARSLWDDKVNKGDHHWQLSGAERNGVVAYIRSLEEVRVVKVWID